MKIGLDVDGCIYQWSPTVREILKRERNIDLSESESWNWIKDSIPSDVWKWLWAERLEAMFIHGDYYPGAIDAVDELIYGKHEIYFITAAPKQVRTQRATNLFKHFPGIYGVVFVDPGSDDKTFVQCDIYCDDKAETALNSANAEWGHSLLMTRPWNRNLDIQHPHLSRVNSWDEVVEQVRKRAKI